MVGLCGCTYIRALEKLSIVCPPVVRFVRFVRCLSGQCPPSVCYFSTQSISQKQATTSNRAQQIDSGLESGLESESSSGRLESLPPRCELSVSNCGHEFMSSPVMILVQQYDEDTKQPCAPPETFNAASIDYGPDIYKAATRGGVHARVTNIGEELCVTLKFQCADGIILHASLADSQLKYTLMGLESLGSIPRVFVTKHENRHILRFCYRGRIYAVVYIYKEISKKGDWWTALGFEKPVYDHTKPLSYYFE